MAKKNSLGRQRRKREQQRRNAREVALAYRTRGDLRIENLRVDARG